MVRKQLLNLFLILIFCAGLHKQLPAQESKSIFTAIGLSTADTHKPQDSDYRDTGGVGEIDKIEVFLDAGNIRLAANAVHGRHKTSETETILRSNTTYAAYRLSSWEEGDVFDFYAMAGIGFVAAALTKNDKTLYFSDEYGTVLGAGFTAYLSSQFGIGIQILEISASGELAGESVETGSYQQQIQYKYLF